MLNSKDSFKKKMPNMLTIGRIVIIPLFVFLLINPTELSRFWAAIIFIFASLTDWLDGYLARIYNAQSKSGFLMDPLADKILVMAALVMLSALPVEQGVPGWITVLLLGRELLVTGLRSVAALDGVPVPASRAAKHKTGWTMASIILLLFHQLTISQVEIPCHLLGMIALVIASGLSIFSGIDYAINLKKHY